MTIKTLLILGLVAAAALVLRGKMTSGCLAIMRLATVALLALGAVAITFPATVTAIANSVGVGRGTDLVLYLLVVAFLIVSVALYRKLRDIEDRYVELVRHIAITDANRASRGESSPPVPRV